MFPPLHKINWRHQDAMKMIQVETAQSTPATEKQTISSKVTIEVDASILVNLWDKLFKESEHRNLKIWFLYLNNT